jgi:hypothetical protein
MPAWSRIYLDIEDYAYSASGDRARQHPFMNFIFGNP